MVGGWRIGERKREGNKGRKGERGERERLIILLLFVNQS